MNKNFLSKKSWHTGSIKHMEKVWKAEQRDLDEKKKTDLLKRELAEEQRMFELRHMAEVATGKPIVDKVDWMYSVKKGPSAEEYLTGTAMRQQEEERELDLLAKKPGALFLNQINPQQDAASKVRDDPLLAIKQQEQKSLKRILDNPLQMKKIKESKSLKKALKKLKKLKKKEKKESSSGSSDEESKEKTRKRSRSNSPPMKKRSSSRSPKRKDSSRSPKRRGSSRSPKRRNSSRSPKRRDSSRSPKRYERRDERREERREDSFRDRRGGKDPRNQRPKMTEEERKKRLEEMKKDAEVHEDRRWKRIKEEKEIEKKDQTIENQSSNQNGRFLNDMNRGIYLEHDNTLEDRIKTHIHTVQRNTGTALIHEEGGFL